MMEYEASSQAYCCYCCNEQFEVDCLVLVEDGYLCNACFTAYCEMKTKEPVPEKDYGYRRRKPLIKRVLSRKPMIYLSGNRCDFKRGRHWDRKRR